MSTILGSIKVEEWDGWSIYEERRVVSKLWPLLVSELLCAKKHNWPRYRWLKEVEEHLVKIKVVNWRKKTDSGRHGDLLLWSFQIKAKFSNFTTVANLSSPIDVFFNVNRELLRKFQLFFSEIATYGVLCRFLQPSGVFESSQVFLTQNKSFPLLNGSCFCFLLWSF